MSFFKGANNVDAEGKLPYLPTNGQFVVEIHRALVKDTRKSGLAYIVEFDIRESSDPDVKVGSRRMWFQSMKERETAFKSLAGFLHAALGLDPVKDKEQIDRDIKPIQEQLLDETVEKNSLSGVTLRVETNTILKKDGSPFTLHSFRPVTSQKSPAVHAA